MSASDPGGQVLGALRRAQELGFLGAVALEEQLAHAEGFLAALHAGVTSEGGDGSPPGPGHIPLSGPGTPRSWLDLGSGGGLPGLVLAWRWADARGVLLDSSRRRTGFLAEVVSELGWEDRIAVLTARAEDAGRDPHLRAAFDAVVARSFGPPAVTAECAAPFLQVGGRLVVSEPPLAEEGAPATGGPPPPEQPDGGGRSGRWPRDPLATLGMEPAESVRGRFGYQVIRQAAPCPDRYPRRSGIPGKRPLYLVR